MSDAEIDPLLGQVLGGPASETPDVILGPDPVLVHWRPAVARAVPELRDAVMRFDPGDREAGQACAHWLRERALQEPPEAATRLLVQDGRVLGFFALTNGHAELRRDDREALGLTYVTQPAVVLAQVARAGSEPGVGEDLLLIATAVARRAAEFSAATVLALDPYDEPTSIMWQERFGFRESAKPGPGRPAALKRLWVPLVTRS